MDYTTTDIIPVSDPNASTMAQRVAQYQSLLQLAQQAPNLYDLPLLHRQMIEVLGVKNASELVPDKDDVKPCDPITENTNLLQSKPVKAFAYQDHEAHIKAHQAFADDPKIQQIVQAEGPGAQQKVMAMHAHIAEHVAFLYRAKVEEELGVPLPAYDEERGMEPEQELAISRLVAEAAPRVTGKHQQEEKAKQDQAQAQDPVMQMQQKELQLQEGELQRKMKKDEMDHQIKLAQVQIDAARIQSDERKSGAALGAKLREADAKIKSDEKKTGVKIGADLSKNKGG
jgi:hypothetical protein